MVCFMPISVNNNPYNVAQNDKMVAINSTLSMDITGQCCSESFGPAQYSATGGQVDFTKGAWMSRGGKAFIALHSTAKDKEHRRDSIQDRAPIAAGIGGDPHPHRRDVCRHRVWRGQPEGQEPA